MSDAIEKVLAGEARWTVEHGDALEVMAEIEAVSAIVTDPPYPRTGDAASIVSTKGRVRTPKEDQFFESWFREHLREWDRVLRSNGASWLTTDSRGLRAIESACVKVGFSQPATGIWVRGGLGMGYVMRHIHEHFCVFYKRDFVRRVTDEPDVWIHDWVPASRQSGHPNEKPVPLMARAVELVCGRDDIVLDPFCGSGSTGVASLRLGRRFIGIERDAEWVAIARARIAAEERNSTVAALRAGQEPLFREASAGPRPA